MNVSDLGTILGVWAHPDDETWSSAGVMQAAVANKQRVVCLIATHGSKGKTADESRWPRKDLGRIRQQEMKSALACLGVSEIIKLDYPDGELISQDQDQAIEKICQAIKSVQPDTIISFEPQGITGHDDHKAVSVWAQEAARRCGGITVLGACESKERYEKVGCRCHERFNVYFNTDKPVTVAEKKADLCYRLSPTEQSIKTRALAEHHSQTEQFFNDECGREYIKALCRCECFIQL